MEPKSPLDHILSRGDFKPFAGPRALRVLEYAKAALKMPPIEEATVLKAVSSLGVLLETEVAMILALQNRLCTRCGDCCRTRGSIRVRKEELKRIADYRKTSYKRLKDEVRAVPLGDGTFRVPQPCRLLKGNDCSAYPARPAACQSYPASELLKNLPGGGGDDWCPIDDQLLAEIVVKRVIEERLFMEDPEELKRMAEQRRSDLAALSGLTPQERLSRLATGYSKYLQNEDSDSSDYIPK